jgi:hypothetical protein
MSVSDDHGRVQYAHAAKDAAAEVACDPTSSREERVAARELVVKAMRITGELTKLSPARQAEIATQSQALEID